MCYRVISHMLRCDVRPLLSDGQMRMVDGYAPPRGCGCERSTTIKDRLRCEHHGCCRVAVKTHLCADPDSCGDTVIFHIYRQVKFEVRDWSQAAGSDEAWRALAVLDGGRFPRGGQAPGTRLRFETPAFQAALEDLLRCGRRIAGLEDMVDGWAADRERLKAEHGGGRLGGVVELLRAAVGHGVLKKLELADRFGRERERLRRLAHWGERPVTGLERRAGPAEGRRGRDLVLLASVFGDAEVPGGAAAVAAAVGAAAGGC